MKSEKCQAEGCDKESEKPYKSVRLCYFHGERFQHTGSTEDVDNRSGGVDAIETRDPEKGAEALDALTDPFFDNLSQTAKRIGLSNRALCKLKERMEKRYLPLTNQIKAYKVNHLLERIDEKIAMSLEYMDEVQFATASLKDNAIAFSILVEKRQLLRGEPTQIFSIEERQNLNDILPALIREAKRRGFTYDMQPTRADDEEGVSVALIPPETAQQEYLSTTAIHLRDKLPQYRDDH